MIDPLDLYNAPDSGSNGVYGESPIVDPSGHPYRRLPTSADYNKPYDDMPLPHVSTFQTIFGGAYRTYVHERFDEAMRNDRDAGRAMLRDAFLLALIQERILATSSLKWHLEVDNQQDPYQKQVKDGMTTLIRRIPRLRRMMRMMLWAIWYGRYGVQVKWEWARVAGVGEKCLTIQKHLPISGDKIGHKFNGTPYVLIHGGESNKIPGAEITFTTLGKAVVLSGSWRERVFIHYSDPFDEDFFTIDQQEAIHGVGIRSRLYFMDWLRKEYIGWYIDTLERTGLGFLVWRYPAGNAQAKAEAMREARKHSRRTNLVLPYYESASGKSPGVEHTETPVAGVELVLELQRHIEEHQERFVTGQSLSTQDKATSGAEVADLRAATKAKLTQADADELAETMTGSKHQPGPLNIIQRYTYPWADFPCRFIFDIDSMEPSKKLEAAERAYSMGATLAEADVIALAGMREPQPGEKTLSQQSEMAQMGGGQEEPGMSGMPGEEGGGEGGEKGWSIIHGPRGGRWMKNKKTGEVRHAAIKDLSQSHLPAGQESRKNETFQREQPWRPSAKHYSMEEVKKKSIETRMNGESLAAETARLWNERDELPSEHEMHLIGGFLAPLDWVVWYDHENHQWEYCHACDWHGEEPTQYAFSAMQARAPKGGVTIGGKFYRGGQWIPKNAGEVTTTDFSVNNEPQAEEHGQLKPKRQKPKEQLGQQPQQTQPEKPLEKSQEQTQDGGTGEAKKPQPSPRTVKAMRQWLTDNMDRDLSGVSDEEIRKGIDTLYQGGVENFMKIQSDTGAVAAMGDTIASYLQGAGKEKIATLQKVYHESNNLDELVTASRTAWLDAKDELKRYADSKKRKTVKVKEEISRMQEALELKQKSYEAVKTKNNQALEEQRAAVDKALAIPNNPPLHPKMRMGAFDGETTTDVYKGFRVLSGWTKGIDKMKVNVIHEPSRGRRPAYATGEGNILGVNRMGQVAVVHELGHAIEDQLGVHGLCKAFLEYRVGDEPEKPLNDVLVEQGITAAQVYDVHETGRKDNFDRHFKLAGRAYYAGKKYANATEILSMGIEALWDDAPAFAAEDPEYAGFVMGVLDGSIR